MVADQQWPRTVREQGCMPTPHRGESGSYT